jgi:uncharacterized protein (TIGR04255 family)
LSLATAAPINDIVTIYAKAPITEAIIEFQVENPEGLAIDALEKLHVQVADGYPHKDAIRLASITAQVEADKDIMSTTTSTPLGWAFAREDRRQVFNARLNGFAFARLYPYETWGAFRTEARRLWNLYRAAASPVAVTRIGVRYINRLDLPLPFTDFKEFLRATPELPPELPQSLSGYFFQTMIPIADLSAMLVLSQGRVPPAKPEHASIVLDIDLFRDEDLPTNDDDLWQLLDRFRLKKDEVFEACITQKTREMIK